jgi:toxin-antitoxin system PIN domain toxin
MKPYLLDVNVLIALTWPSHVFHPSAQQWFAVHREAGFRTCPLTQIEFLRISSHPKFHQPAVSPLTAVALLQRITAMKEHEFWADDLPCGAAIGTGPVISGHNQIVDAYLIALAASRDGVVATLDRGMLSLAGAQADRVEVLIPSAAN